MRVSCAVLLALPAIAMTACGGSTSPASPSSVELQNPTSITITMSGMVRDADNNAGLAGADVQIASGPDATRSTTTDASGNYSLGGLKVGLFAIRFGRPGYETVERNVSTSQDMRIDVQLRRGQSCMALPAPTGLRASVASSRVTFNWDPVATATEYVIGVGTAPGSTNIMAPNTSATTYLWRGAPAGTFFARVGARAGCSHMNASNEITFSVNP